MSGYTPKVKTVDLAVPAGGSVSYGPIPPNTSVCVNPGGGGSMSVQYRVTPNGPLLPWISGSVSAATSDTFAGPIFELLFSAVTAAGSAGVATWA